MLLLLIEIGLTVASWKRGWKWRALLPLVAIFAAGMVFGGIAGATGGPAELPPALAVVSDILIIVPLVIMITKPRLAPQPHIVVNDVACPECGRTFPGESMLSRHRDSVHGQRGAGFEQLAPQTLEISHSEDGSLGPEIQPGTARKGGEA